MQFGLVTIALAGISLTWSSPTTDAIHITKTDGRRTCTVFARGEERSDVDNIIKAFDICQNHAKVVFPEDQTYWIDKKLHITLRDVTIHWSGEWMFSRNTAYWRHNSYYIPFQNHRAGFIISGDKIHVDGFGRGGIDGNGDVWYDEDKGKSTEGRPMFWSVNIMNGSNLTFENLTSSAFSNNAPAGANWVQNADGFSAISPAATQMIRYGWDMRWSVYIKTWMGFPVPQPSDVYENEGKPRGGGWGRVHNLLFSNFELRNVSRGPFITQDNGDNGTYRGTSKIEISDVVFRNFTGNLKSSGGRLGDISCSEEKPCFDISFEDMDQLEAAGGKSQLERSGEPLVVRFSHLDSAGEESASAYVARNNSTIHAPCSGISVRPFGKGIGYPSSSPDKDTIDGYVIHMDARSLGQYAFTATATPVLGLEFGYGRCAGMLEGELVGSENSTSPAIWDQMGPFG
ncbi:hypothetical protein FDECE_2709 [Fusarium decemcellulare]|nr:hypothetical protein FDECE_2709 [Fusarium decemcellulare]